MKIKDTDKKKLLATITNELSKAYKIAGYSINNLTDTVNLMCENLIKHFPNNDLSDIAIAFEKGALGEYGDYAGISVRTLYGWMRTYNGNAVNRVAEIDQDTHSIEDPKRDKAQDGRNLVNACYKTFCEKGCFFVPSSLLLRILKDNGFVVTDDDIASAKIIAESNLHDQFIHNRSRFIRLRDFIERNIDTEANGVIVKNYFTQCMKENKGTIF